MIDWEVHTEMANRGDILEFFAPRYCRREVDNCGNALEGIREITLDEILDYDDVDLVAVLGVRLPQRISLSGTRDTGEAFSVVTTMGTVGLLTLGRGTPLVGGGSQRVSRCIRKHQ